MNIWLTSDQHFWHKNVIEYCDRPFKTLEEMHRKLIGNYRALVQPNDICFFLGDFCFGGVDKVKEILDQLPGQKYLITGNHDVQNNFRKWISLGFIMAQSFTQINDFNVSHFPYLDKNHDGRVFEEQIKDDGRWLLHGHVHHHWKQKGRMINVGVDVWDFWPVNLRSLMALREYK